jgi:hypothetical protein
VTKSVTLLLVLVFLTALCLIVPFPVKADSNSPIDFSGGVTMYSPVNTTYYINFLTLNLTCSCGAGLDFSLNYSIDGEYQGPITLMFNSTYGFQLISLGTGLVQLPELPSGSHRLTVWEEAYLNDYHGANPPGAPFKPTAPGSADYFASWVDIVYFMIDSNATQLIPKPSVPEFTVKFADNSYDVSSTYGVDPYTGKEVITQAGYHVQNRTIEVAIKNQPFTPYEDANGNSIGLYYSVRVKGYFGDSWGYPNFGYYYVEGDAEANYVGADIGSNYTVITYGLVGNNGTQGYLCLDISAGGQADFQVRAFIGYDTRTTSMTPLGESYRDVFTGETSDWSSTQTLTIPTSPSPTGSPPPELLAIILAVALIVAIIGAGLLVYFKKRRCGAGKT